VEVSVKLSNIVRSPELYDAMWHNPVTVLSLHPFIVVFVLSVVKQ